MFKKMPINRTLYDVYDENEYNKRFNTQPQAMRDLESSSAVLKGDYVYPLQNPKLTYITPGVKNYGSVLEYQHPQTEEDKQMYNKSNMIDFDNNKTGCAGMIQRTAELAAAEHSILLKKDNVAEFVIREEDTPEFKLLKQALTQKNVDINSYKHRFQSEFSNDLRILTQSNSITFNKLRTIANATDIEVEIIIRDKPGCVNPIGEELRTIIT